MEYVKKCDILVNIRAITYRRFLLMEKRNMRNIVTLFHITLENDGHALFR
jgi:hypothetical protein